MNAKDLKAWMQRNELSKFDVHRKTGVSRTTLDRYISGKNPIPKLFHLACAAIDNGIDVD